MADAPKDKPKKKKSSTKKTSLTNESPGADPTELAKPEEQTQKTEEPAPASEEQNLKPEEAVSADQPAPDRKKSVKAKKAKPADGDSENAEASEEQVQREQNGGNEIDHLPNPDEMPQIHASYVVPPPAPPTVKPDVNLLKELDETKLQELKEAFELFDLNQDGFIDQDDLKMTFISLGQLDVEDELILNMLSEAVDPLDFESFVILLGYKTFDMDPEAVLVEALSQWDYDNSGMISEERIRHDLMTWGDKFSPEEALMALEDAPTYTLKGKTMIDYIKFCNTLCGLKKKTKMPQPEDFMTSS